MALVRLVHWKESEGRERARELRAAGLRVEYEADASAGLRACRDDPPDAIVIDLTRLPSHGREVAWALRQNRKTRAIPLVFVGGDPLKVARLSAELPDAAFVEWPGAARAVERALAAAPADPVVPARKYFYGSKALVEKLGLAPGATLALVEAPPGFERVLGKLPPGCSAKRSLRGRADLVLWFVRSRAELRRALPCWKRAVAAGTRLWVAWPKKTSPLAGDLDQGFVRATPHAHGLVDYKICALDADWSGMCFGRRRGSRGNPTRAAAP
jgi:CheY-like chemotaxis protein